MGWRYIRRFDVAVSGLALMAIPVWIATKNPDAIDPVGLGRGNNRGRCQPSARHGLCRMRKALLD